MIKAETVKHVADLARLEVSEEQAEVYAGQLGHILEYIEQLRELDTTGVEPTAHALSLTNVLREDLLKPSLPREILFENAPSCENEMFKVPRILE
ncbi:MAG TPA: Asp-tRNA(Asn)/Glu-tRNA(Gln) amidotransferase GatCAB subunit C [Cyanobacteria bacterium UBA8530]|nr:Asp-tRNA(Asn)/Glu-tRNA(Gln) amidotransferase GatCAB subunit C [Cyanobacteria bacterium UBA8530]